MTTEILPVNSGPELPALIASAGVKASWRFLEFFTVNIRNKNTRPAYGRAAAAFLAWCEERGISELREIQPVHVAAYIDGACSKRSTSGPMAVDRSRAEGRSLRADPGFMLSTQTGNDMRPCRG